MTRKPKTPDLPRNKNQVANRSEDNTMGEVEDEQPVINEAARTRSEAQAKKLGPERRGEIARKAAVGLGAKVDRRS